MASPRIIPISSSVKSILLNNAPIQTVHKLFNQNNFKIRIAGGFVRDACCLNKNINDIDLATDATPLEMLEMFEKNNIKTFNRNGEAHGTVSCLIEDEQLEITTLRSDVLTDGRHAKVSFHRDWKLDAERRDLTIGAMFLDLDNFTVIDYFNGYEHCLAGVVEFVGCSESRIKEDYLRILRYFRFLGRLNEDSDKIKEDRETLEVIKEYREGLGEVANERKWVEIGKIITDPHLHGYSLMKLMLKDCKLASVIGLGILKTDGASDSSKLSIDEYLKNFKQIYLKQKVLIKKINDELTELKVLDKKFAFSAGVPFLCPLVEKERILSVSKELKLSNAHRDDAVFALLYKDQLDEMVFKYCSSSRSQSPSNNNEKDQITCNLETLILNLQKVCFRFQKLVPNVKQRIIYMIICYESIYLSSTLPSSSILSNSLLIQKVFSDEFTIPKLPVNGNDLVPFLNLKGKQRRHLSVIIKKLDRIYEDADFTSGKEYLLDQSKQILDELVSEKLKQDQSKKEMKRLRKNSDQ